ncbi:hypothetical protein [Amycolatopsis regifaucium]|uniref:Uncharacterized protein n=1 Tax=Amycolatopsis regifaucium TaxID=546365 RepID=A0A154M6Z8_9PSEU|nr:hypothetical protein AVL48_14530 [Amycolatopsis regifaucium]OKA10054.1 hypothetical protein ATP06_0206885 [Amycolatopsis regifaucium]SFI63206.1 hypothetical protein SAMN04489731_1128 [Amycolatopsis regifaucium]
MTFPDIDEVAVKKATEELAKFQAHAVSVDLEMMRAAGRFPRLRLQHTHHGWKVPGGWISTYSSYPIRVARPAKGVKVAPVRCGVCGDEIDVRVYSARHTKWARLLLLLTGVGSLVALVTIGKMVVERDSIPGDLPAPLFGVVVVAWLAGSVFALVGSLFYDGVRLPPRTAHALHR